MAGFFIPFLYFLRDAEEYGKLDLVITTSLFGMIALPIFYFVADFRIQAFFLLLLVGKAVYGLWSISQKEKEV